jgi:hypothetical protein
MSARTKYPPEVFRELCAARPKLSSTAVTELFMHCLADEPDPLDQREIVQGIVHTVAFSALRIHEADAAICHLLSQLPPSFIEGGGWALQNLCVDRDGNQWTGFQLVMEQLVQLGLAAGRVRFCLSRDMWTVFPGGMPYVAVTLPAPLAPGEFQAARVRTGLERRDDGMWEVKVNFNGVLHREGVYETEADAEKQALVAAAAFRASVGGSAR